MNIIILFLILEKIIKSSMRTQAFLLFLTIVSLIQSLALADEHWHRAEIIMQSEDQLTD